MRFSGKFAALAVLTLLAAGGTGAAVFHARKVDTSPQAATIDPTETSSVTPTSQLGPSGLPIPRFVTLKANKVNVRRGPSSDHAVAWVFQRKGLPVEITAEFENWRRVRDSDGEEGWILQSMLSGKRRAFVAKWARNNGVILHDEPSANSDVVATLATGVLADIESCGGTWCYVSADGYEGYAAQDELWGVYPGEKLD